MNGYWGVSAAPATGSTTARSDDWLVTSDVGYWDSQGNLWFCGRKTDSIRTGGETVFAGEVERVLGLHPSILEVAVFGLPDAKFGHAVACAIVTETIRTQQCDRFSVQSIRRWCEQHGLAGYKRPRMVFHVESIPKNASDKPLKYLLVKSFSGQSAATATKSGPMSKL
jgi:fatty-acyl-CoA synthase